MRYSVCVSCGTQEGSMLEIGGTTSRIDLFKVDLLPIWARNDTEGAGSVWVCKVCKDAIGFDLSALQYERLKIAGDPRTGSPLITQLIIVFIRDIWPYDAAPSYSDILSMFYNIGISSPTGKPWTYHNLRQWMKINLVDIEEIMKLRPVAVESGYDKARRLLGYTKESEHTQKWNTTGVVSELPIPKPGDIT